MIISKVYGEYTTFKDVSLMKITFPGFVSKTFLKNLIDEHFKETNSKLSENILNNFNTEIANFFQICPKEMIDKLENPISIKDLRDQAS